MSEETQQTSVAVPIHQDAGIGDMIIRKRASRFKHDQIASDLRENKRTRLVKKRAYKLKSKLLKVFVKGYIRGQLHMHVRVWHPIRGDFNVRSDVAQCVIDEMKEYGLKLERMYNKVHARDVDAPLYISVFARDFEKWLKTESAEEILKGYKIKV